MCVVRVSSDCFCQRTNPIFTSRTDAYFPVFLHPTLSQSILPVFIHEICLTAGFVLLCLTKSPLISRPTIKQDGNKVKSGCRETIRNHMNLLEVNEGLDLTEVSNKHEIEDVLPRFCYYLSCIYHLLASLWLYKSNYDG